MALKPGQYFAFMESAYRHGVLDKYMPLFGAALESVRERRGIGIEDLLDKLDRAGEGALAKADRLIMFSGPLLSIAGSEPVMSIASRLLDFHAVRVTSQWLMRWLLEMALARSEGLPLPVTQAIRGLRSGRGRGGARSPAGKSSGS